VVNDELVRFGESPLIVIAIINLRIEY
jgi:hypothetical protein